MSDLGDRLFEKLTGAPADIDKDISQQAAANQPRNALLYFTANCIGKLADELSSARLILPWLFGALAVPVGLVALLVPLREAGVLLPQMSIAAIGQRFHYRRGLWIFGAGLSGLALLVMAITALTLTGVYAGLLLLFLLGLYSLGRGVCSVTAKEVVGKIVAKSIRGRLMGYSTSISGVLLLGSGLWLLQPAQLSGATQLAMILLFASVLWVVAIFLFALIEEPSQRAQASSSITQELRRQWQMLRSDGRLQRFIWVRALLLSTALAHPFVVILIQAEEGSGVLGLGYLLIVSALVSAVAAPIWGYFSDLNAAVQMGVAALLSALASLAAGLAGVYQLPLGLIGLLLIYALLTLAHTGVRLGRKVYLLDMSDSDTRGAYTALANTLIGLAMLVIGFMGTLAHSVGAGGALVGLGLLGLIAGWQALKLRRVSQG